MKYEGTITRVQRGGGGVTLIVETVMGLRGVELDSELWQSIMTDFDVKRIEDVVGWQVEYDPAHGDLEIIGEVVEEVAEDDLDAQNEGHDDLGDDRAG